MKVWELMAALGKMPAGHTVDVRIHFGDGDNLGWMVGLDDYVSIDEDGEATVLLRSNYRECCDMFKTWKDEQGSVSA